MSAPSPPDRSTTRREPHAVPIEALASAIYDGAVDPILVLSAGGHVLDANEPALRMFGVDVIGHAFEVPATAGDTAEVEVETAAGPRVAELRIGSAQLNGDLVHVATLRDVTERRNVEESLRDFVSTASHEFRTPLFAIQGFAEAMQAQWTDLSEADLRNYVGIIHRQAKRLTRLTDDLLTVAQLDGEAISAQPRPTAPVPVVEAAVALVGLPDVRVDVPEDLHLHVDPGHLEDILVNLLTNAEKYGEPPFAVAGSRDGAAGLLRVVDRGQGVPVGFRARMFDRFSRERRAARHQPGSGLGLAIVRGLVDRNGGALAYEDTPGGGATFVLRLPLATA